MKKWNRPEVEEIALKMTSYYNHNHKDWCPACRDPKDVCWCGTRKSGNVGTPPDSFVIPTS